MQHREAAQLLADQGLTGCLLAMAAWMVAPDGGGALASPILQTNYMPVMGRIDAPVMLLPTLCSPLHLLLPSRQFSPLNARACAVANDFQGPSIPWQELHSRQDQ